MQQRENFWSRYRNISRTVFILTTAAIAVLLGCVHNQNNETNSSSAQAKIIQGDGVNRMPTNYPNTYSRYQSSFMKGGNSSSADRDVEKTDYLDQKWASPMREAFYRTPQGSHIMPLKFALALEQATYGEKFFSSENLSKYGYIPQKVNDETNPFGLPIGFTIDGNMGFTLDTGTALAAIGLDSFKPRQVGERQLGMNCAACHTANLRYKDKVVRIDGGQGFTNFQKFVSDMDEAIESTAKEQNKMNRLVTKVLDLMDGKGDKQKIRDEFEKLRNERAEWRSMNESRFMAGPARVDAFSIIFNQVIARDLGIPENHREPVNPVSYPVIWDGPHHDFVQWNGLASNSSSNGGPLARNTGEVLGVFGKVDLSNTTQVLNGYCSTVRRFGLEVMEDWLRELTSPKWPKEVFEAGDTAQVILAREGKITLGSKVYEKNCIGCHAVINSRDPKREIKAKLIPTAEVGTDPQFNQNALSWTAKTSIEGDKKIEGRLTRLKEGRPLLSVEPAVTVLKHVVAGAMAGTVSPLTCTDSVEVPGIEFAEKWAEILKKGLLSKLEKPHVLPDDSPNIDVRMKALKDTLDVYKARPLNGIWSSAPFLHNGSVKNLYELMLPASQRSKTFTVGCEKFDPVNVGVDCAVGEGVLYDTALPGNRNMGHEFGAKLTEKDRWALIEYIKTL